MSSIQTCNIGCNYSDAEGQCSVNRGANRASRWEENSYRYYLSVLRLPPRGPQRCVLFFFGWVVRFDFAFGGGAALDMFSFAHSSGSTSDGIHDLYWSL